MKIIISLNICRPNQQVRSSAAPAKEDYRLVIAIVVAIIVIIIIIILLLRRRERLEIYYRGIC